MKMKTHLILSCLAEGDPQVGTAKTLMVGPVASASSYPRQDVPHQKKTQRHSWTCPHL
jgi:hypothetical protein